MVKPDKLDDLCYALFNLFKNKNVSITYEKPFCYHMLVAGDNYEVRLYIAHQEVHLSILVNIDTNILSSSIKNILSTFSDIDNIFSRLCSTAGKIHLILRISFWIKRVEIGVIEGILKNLGIAISLQETHRIDSFTVSSIRGKIVGKNLKVYSIVIVFFRNNVVEVSISIESEVEDEDILSQLIELQDTVYNIAENMIFSISSELEDSK